MSARSRFYSCIIAMHNQNNCVFVCVRVRFAEKIHGGAGAKIALSISWGFG